MLIIQYYNYLHKQTRQELMPLKAFTLYFGWFFQEMCSIGIWQRGRLLYGFYWHRKWYKRKVCG